MGNRYQNSCEFECFIDSPDCDDCDVCQAGRMRRGLAWAALWKSKAAQLRHLKEGASKLWLDEVNSHFHTRNRLWQVKAKVRRLKARQCNPYICWQFQKGEVAGLVGEDDPNSRNVLTEVFESFLDERERLGGQLDLAHGNLSEEEFLERAQVHIIEYGEKSERVLKAKILMILECTTREVDAETLSTLFRCTIAQAEKALLEVLNEDA